MKICAHRMNIYILHMVQKTNTYRKSASPEPAGGRIEHSPCPHGFASECLIILMLPTAAAAAAAAAVAAAAAAAAARGSYVVISIVVICGGSIREKLKLLRACLQYVMGICEAVYYHCPLGCIILLT